MMAELEVDQTNLPRVQEVCQCFSVLEDGALAHNLQEQEIEQYYSTNIQKNQLVQNDIRVAKKLQDEEEEQWAQQSALHRQVSKQLEERDFEYARLIQEEILRCAEEAQRREQDDEEMAKRIHDEETQCMRRASRGQDNPSEGSATTPPLPPPPQHTLCSPEPVEEQCSTSATRWHSSTSYRRSSVPEPKADSCRAVAPPNNTNSWSNERHTDSFRKFRSKFREHSSEDSEDSDTVFSEHSALSKRANDRIQASPLRRQGSLHHPHRERQFRSRNSGSSVPDELEVWEEEKEVWEENQYENGEVDKKRPLIWRQARLQREECEGLRDSDKGSGFGEVGERRCSRSESLRLHDRRRQSNRELARTWSYRDNADKHVHFRDESRSNSREVQSGNGVWAMLGHVLRERGVPVRISNNGASLQILGPRSRDSQVLHGSEGSCSDSRPHQRSFQRASATRHSFHGDVGEKRRSSHRESSGRDHREDKERLHNIAERGGEVYEISSRESSLANREKGGSRRWRDHGAKTDHMRDWNENDFGVSGTTDERRNRCNAVEERVNSEEETWRRRDQPGQRAPQRSQSLRSSSSSSSSSRASIRASTRRRSRHVAADSAEARLDLGELQQVLQDEELARKMQEDEENRLRRNSSAPSCYPEGDFRVAQVAQDEEIAHFMQKQEMKSKRRSRELEGPSSWREHRAMISHHDRRAARDRDRQGQRERLDSEGLPSPIEDCSPENQPPSPTSTTLQSQHIRNIAEELDPTFQARRLSTERDRDRQTGLDGQTLPVQQHDFLAEPTFVAPTKRQADKSERSKPKEKKENCKQQ
ncbi:coiled-coil domain-containing protein 187 isoform X2 [Takifugu flavidus]|uniref:coiled-coil domain-containing protein 187 isoform X2 n=1 Tax=Takifugu flavidus TaxID=433684 RepID=UPI0025441014|nr:coiled-coil domain-containing protein 187 isoform X2 [Takifugu flavidus]